MILQTSGARIFSHVGAVIVFFGLAAFPSLYHGLDRSVLANADMDFISIYQAALMLAGEPLEPNVHTGYLSYLLLAAWYAVLDWMHVIRAADINSLLTAGEFHSRFAELMAAARWFSVVQATALVTLIYAGAVMITGRRLTAFLLCVLLAVGGGGLAAQSVMLRTELLSMVFIVVAALLLLKTASVSYRTALVLLILAGVFSHFAMMVKIQSILLLVFLPLLPTVLHWGHDVEANRSSARSFDIAISLGAVLAAIAFFTFNFGSLTGHSMGKYQFAIAAYLVAAALVYGHFHLGSVRRGLIGMAAVVFGGSLAYAVYLIFPSPWTNCGTYNFLEIAASAAIPLPDEAATIISGTRGGETSANSSQDIGAAFDVERIIGFFTRRISRFDYPFFVIYLAVPAAIIGLVLQRRFVPALKAGLLVGMAGFVVVASWVAKGEFHFYYSIYVEAWVILAAAYIAKDLATSPGAFSPRHRRIGWVGLLVGGIAVIGFNTAFRLTNPGAANTRAPTSACYILAWTPRLIEPFTAHCEKTWDSSQFNDLRNYRRPELDATTSRAAKAYPSAADRMLVHPTIASCIAYWTRPSAEEAN